MHLEIAKREEQKLRLALYGRAGSGKTYSSLLLAYGLCGDWSKIALIDTEDGSASLYSHLGPFNTVITSAPFNPACFDEAIELCLASGKKVIIIDSLSAEWNGQGGILESLHTPLFEDALRDHRTIIRLLSTVDVHFICTMRSRQKIVRVERSRIHSYQLLEYPVQQEGIEYAFTTVLKMGKGQRADAVKDRTGIFINHEPQRLEVDHGRFLARWCTGSCPSIGENQSSNAA